MVQKRNNYYLKIKHFFWKLINFKKDSKLQEYKKCKKKKIFVKNKKEIKRNKYNIQLNLNLNSKQQKKIIINIIIFVIIIFLVLIKWPFFKIQNINIIKLDQNVNTYLIEKQLNNIKTQLLFSINNENITSIIKNSQQNISNINITKKLPNTLNIRLSSFPTLFKTILNWKNYLITTNWVLIPTKSTKNSFLNLTIKNLEYQNYPNYKKLLKQENLQKIVFFANQLKENLINIEIEDIIYYKTEKEIHFIINNKTRLIFDLEWNNQEQLTQLFVFNKEKLDITKPWIIYIDNRIKSKILYCPSSELDSCIKSINYIYNENIESSHYEIKE